jgi:hypothetical protein
MSNEVDRKKTKYCLYLVQGIVLLYPLSDLISILGDGNFVLGRFSLIIRGIFLVVATFLLVKFEKVKKINFIIFVVFLLPIYSMVNMYNNLNSPPDTFVIESLIIYVKTLSIFIFIPIFYNAFQGYPKKVIFLGSTFFIIYLLAIFISFVFSIDLMKTYTTNRFGYKGIVSAANEIASLAIISTVYFLALRKKKLISIRGYRSRILILVLATLLMGTKGALIGILLAYFIYKVIEIGIIKGVLLSLTISFFMICLIYICYLYIPSFESAIDGSIDYFTWAFHNFADGSIITLLLSGRDLLLIDTIYLMNSFEVLEQSLIFGGWLLPFSFIEMDFFELVFLMGLPIFCIFITAWTSLFLNSKNLALSVSFIFSWISMAFLAGHLFTSAFAVPMLCFLSCLIKFEVLNIKSIPNEK